MAKSDILISACLVVYHEEALIERCLQTLPLLCDEIIVLHDGPCSDRTLEIAARFGARCEEAPRTGQAEAHRVASYVLAQGRWIFQIDADEFLDEQTARELRARAEADDLPDGVALLWPIWDGERVLSHAWPYRPCLFKRSSMSYIGYLHSVVDVPGGYSKLPFTLQHQPPYNNYGIAAFWRKQLKWARNHARHLKQDLRAFPGYNPPENPKWPLHMEIVRRLGVFAIPVLIPLLALGGLRDGGWREPLAWSRAYTQALSYYCAVSFYYTCPPREPQA